MKDPNFERMIALKLSKISKSFGPTVALDGVDLDLREGEVHALIGENGAGKSTLMNIIAGSLHPDQGTMEIHGKPYAPSNPLDARTHGIALIHQELSLCPHLSVAENVMMGIESSQRLSHLGWLDRDQLIARTNDVLKTFHHADIRPEKRVGDLSVAARQIVEISRALAAHARIILMDEPTSSLQREDVAHLFTLIRKLSAEGISVIYISHFLEEVRQISDRFTVLRDGRSVATGEIASVTDNELIAKMVGRAQQNLFPVRSRATGERQTILDVQNLASPPLLKSASFELRRGEILGIAGLMGSGRTPLLRTIFGLERPESGTIRVNKKSLRPGSSTPAMRLIEGLGYLSEDRKGEGLTLNQSIADNVTVTRFNSCSRWGWLDLGAQRKQTEKLVNALKIRTRGVQQSVESLSGGNQQKVIVARLLHQDADVLLLDEPTRGIDIGSKAQVYETIAALAAQNKAVLMVSSYLPELFGMCDRLAVMSRGRLSEVKPIDQWTPESVLQAAIAAADLHG
ncbi:MAG TPA: sugar ABC transporter ATP-binding protein [Pyrinomonadaceae bacterium]|nr:sugar ABC transporter ATP-binding protein [Pyrinomonadaceae bacterium]